MTLTNSPMLDAAIAFARERFADTLDRDGVPMIEHSLRVMRAGATEDERIVGVLHDVIEDTHATLHDVTGISANGETLAGHIIAALAILTRSEDEAYWQYIERVALDSLAARVKLNDLADNIARGRGLPKHASLAGRYVRALHRLQDGAL